ATRGARRIGPAKSADAHARRSLNRSLLARSLVLASLLAIYHEARADDDARPPLSTGRTFTEQSGEAIYHGVCQGCHMSDGRGAVGAGIYPPLAANPRLASP